MRRDSYSYLFWLDFEAVFRILFLPWLPMIPNVWLLLCANKKQSFSYWEDEGIPQNLLIPPSTVHFPYPL